MNIDKNSINLAEDTYAYVGCVSEEQILETFKNNLKKYIDTIDTMDELTDQGLNKLSDQQYYDLFCKIYNMSLAEEDYLKIISKRNNQKYNRFTEIETFMTFSNLVAKGRDSWKQLYQVRYIVAVSEDTQIEDGIILKKEDIKNMIKNKSIVIVKEKTEPLIEELEINEKFETIPSMNLDDLNSENFPIIISMIKNKLSQKRILKDMKDSFEELKNEIKIVLSNSQSEYLYGEITKLCNEWYEKSEEKNKVRALQKRLFKTNIE